MANTRSTIAVTSLQRLGFSEYEARAYVTLVRKPRLNGYELAKESGIPRANVYTVLAKLVDRGCVLTINAVNGPRYTAVPPQQLMRRIEAEQRDALDATTHSLEGLATSADADEIFTSRGYASLIEHAKSAIGEARETLLLALFPNEAKELEREITGAEERGVAITILCLTGCAGDCGACRRLAYRYRLASATMTRWLIATVDGNTLVAGQVQGDDAMALLSRQKMLVELAGAYIRQSIALASVIEDMGPTLERSLKARTREILQSVSPASGQTFIAYMSDLMSRATVA